jgi:hypothetical protein
MEDGEQRMEFTIGLRGADDRPVSSPNPAHVKFVQPAIGAENGDVGHLRLGDEQAIEWVAVMQGQKSRFYRVFEGNRHFQETLLGHSVLQVGDESGRLNFAGVDLDGEFPSHNSRNDDPVGGASKNLVRPAGQARGVEHPPDDGVRIEQDFHGLDVEEARLIEA